MTQTVTDERTKRLIIKEPNKRVRTKMGKVRVLLCDSHEFWSLHHLTPNYSASEQPTTPTDKTGQGVISTAKWGHGKKKIFNVLNDNKQTCTQTQAGPVTYFM